VAPATRQRVLDTAQEIGYTPNEHARGLRFSIPASSTRTGNIGVVISEKMHPSTFGPFYSQIYQGLQKQANDAGFHLILATVEGYGDKLPSLLQQKKVDGVVLVGYLNEDFVKLIVNYPMHQYPVVLVDRNIEHLEVDTVQSSGYKGSRDATAHLRELGHERIAYVDGWFEDSSSLSSRFIGYRDVMSESNVFDDQLVVKGADFHDRGHSATKILLNLPEPPTAIFYNNDEAALDGLNAIKEAGLSVPGDMSIIGFDDIDHAAHATPALTTVSIDKEGMGKTAIEILVDKITNSKKTVQKVSLSTELTIRQSTAAI
jgi:LacI family transcriptional regulator